MAGAAYILGGLKRMGIYYKDIRIRQIRYEFSCCDELCLHHDIPTITLRGAFGYALAQVIARHLYIPEFEAQVVLYKSFFMPQNDGDEASRNHDLARPFIMRGWYSRPDKRSFILDVHLFGQTVDYETFFDKVIEITAYMGLGIKKQRCRLEKIFSRMIPIEDPEPGQFLTVDFITPCSRLKSDGKIFREEIPFFALFPRLADRLLELDNLYEKGECFSDKDEIPQLKRLSKEILWKKIEGGNYHATRISGRTAQSMKLDGFMGRMEYYGDFMAFRKYLKYLPYINLGRFNVFGCGWCGIKYSQEEY